MYYRHGETERFIIILAILTELGFGLTEFALYVFTSCVPFISRVPGVIFHASSAGITAYGIAKKKLLRFYLVAASLHLKNNMFSLFGVSLLYLPVVAVMVATYLLAWRLHQRTSANIVM